ncbi:uncharacterized protein [Antedon mediterranea]|uniref:uncharacterized protein n=1 Tax=Antedon mediterranea TaxID=105859 RepID=UPI003AF89078
MARAKSAAQRRKEQKMKQREVRACQSQEKLEETRKKCRERMALKREAETQEERNLRIKKVKLTMETNRAKETEEKTKKRLDGEKHAVAERRKQETGNQTKERLKKEKRAVSERRKQETGNQTKERLNREKRAVSERRKQETGNQTKERLKREKRAVSERRKQETANQTKERVEREKRAVSERRKQETSQQTTERLQRKQLRESERRKTETGVQRTLRLREKRTTESLRRENECSDKRSKRLKNSRLTMQNIKQLRRTKIPSNDDIVSDFLKNVKDSADYVCCSCHRMMFRITVVELHGDRYPKAKPSMLENVLSYRITSARGKQWICKTCHLTLKRGKMPTQAKANNLSLTDQPRALTNLNALELRLICQRVPFMKMVGLPRGKQHGIHGPAVNVPAKLDTVCSLFPRLPSETQLIPMKFKRSLKHSSHYIYDYVDIGRVLTALRYLKRDNVWYHEIDIRDNWVLDAENDDKELFQALVCTGSDKKSDENLKTADENSDSEHDGQSDGEKFDQACTCTEVAETSGVTYQICNVDENSDLGKLNTMAKENNMNIVDVPGDGDCMFYCVCYQLERLEITKLNVKELRSCLSKYMVDNADCYRDFVCASVESNGLSNADTEQPAGDDRAISLISDIETRKEIQWIKYLDRLESGTQWGEHISLQAIADMFSLCVFVHTTTNMLKHSVRSRSEVKHSFHVGLIGQSHYVVFEPYAQENNDNDVELPESVWQNYDDDVDQLLAVHEINEEGNNDSDENDAEDADAFEAASKIRGLPYETSMVKENADLKNKLISVAPAESEKPQPILCDPNFEELSNPDKYPDGKNALTAERPIEIAPRKYFNQRLLDVDGRFAKSIEYLLSAQYAVENKQVQGDINHFIFRRTAGKHCHGTRLNVGLTKNVEKMNELIKGDHAYKILKNIRGTPAYFQTVFYDVLAMVRQLGIPTWFFTVSAADMQWADVIQTIARQYGTTLSDDDVRNLSFADRTMWLRSNPVTAARQFQYRLELLFKDVLKSKAHPLGEITDYVIRIEFQARGSPHAHTLLWVKYHLNLA